MADTVEKKPTKQNQHIDASLLHFSKKEFYKYDWFALRLITCAQQMS